MQRANLLWVVLLVVSSCSEPPPTPTPARIPLVLPARSADRPATAGRKTQEKRRPIAPPQPDPRSWAVLDEGLASPDYAIRLFATETLGCMRGTDPLDRLQHMLGDPEEDVRIATVAALHRQPVSLARHHLETVRDDKDETLVVRVLAASALLSPAPTCN